jgi:hypothetical protein
MHETESKDFNFDVGAAAGLEPAQRFLTEGFSYQLRLSPPRLGAFAV